MRFPERLTAAFAMEPGLAGRLFGPAELRRIREVADIDETLTISDFSRVDPRLLAALDIVITGWGSPRIGPAELDAMPRLRAICHAGGTVKGHVAPEVWDRGVLVTTAADVNAYPVAEYTLATILLAGKDVPGLAAAYASDPGFTPASRADIGNYQRTVGIVSASRVGRRVIGLLRQFDFQILLYDPYLPNADPVLTQARRVGLDELFRLSSIVSVHAPLLPETAGLIGPEQLALMSPGSWLINTARGAIVDHDALAEAVRSRGLRAVLDVTSPEPLPASHPLRHLPGVILTPHVAGSLGNELHRLGEAAAREVELLAAGRPPRCPVGKEYLAVMALPATPVTAFESSKERRDVDGVRDRATRVRRARVRRRRLRACRRAMAPRARQGRRPAVRPVRGLLAGPGRPGRGRGPAESGGLGRGQRERP